MALKQIDERVMIDLTKVLFMAFDAGKVKILFENDGIVELTDPDGKIWSVLTATKEPCFNCGGRGGWDVYEDGMSGFKICPFCNGHLLNPDGSLKI